MTFLPTHLLRPAHNGRPSRRWLLAAALGLLGATGTQAQTLNYPVSGAVNTTGTYTDLGATGTIIATANTDDANSAAQNIGFTFNYNGTAFTQFVLNTNGVIRLGSAPPSVATLYYENSTAPTGTDPLASTDAADVNLIMPFNFDLGPGTAGGTEYRMATTGSTGSRICTIQWKNVADFSDATASTQFANFSFQLRLYETGRIEFVYNTVTPSTATAATRFPNVGLKGSGLATGQLLLGLKATASAWSTTTFQSSNYTTASHNVANLAAGLPDAGRTYRFTPTATTLVDAAVGPIYTLGQIAQSYASPHTVRVVVTNNGGATRTNLPVTLTVTGATPFTNTQTVASLASGASSIVTFASYPLTATGNNTVTVTIPSDDVASNNTVSSSQVVGTNLLAYTDPTGTFVSGAGAGANSVLFVKYNITAPTTVTAVTPTFNGTATGTENYQVLVYDATGTGGTPGAVLYTSAVRPRPATAGPEVVTIPATAVSGSFYVAVKQLGTTNIGLAYQAETPTRTGTFYFTTNGTTFVDIATSTLPSRLAIQATLGATATTCPAVTNATIGSLTTTTAQLTFTPAAGATNYTGTLTVTGSGTTPTPVTLTGSPVNLTGLTPNTSYTVTLTTNCSGGATSTPVTVTFTTPATAPVCNPVTALAVGSITQTSASVSFTPGTGNTSYTVTYTPTGGTATTVTPAPTASPVALTGLAAGTTYTVSVTPICAGGGTATATTTTFTTTAAPTCNAVTGLAVGSITQTSASVSFTPGTGNTSYTVTYTPAGGTTTTITPSPTASPVALTGLTAGTTYTVSVTPICAGGGTAAATTATFVTTATTITCNPVTGLAVGLVTTTSASVSFLPGAGNTSYTVTYTPAGGATTTITPAPTSSPVALSGLAPGTTYTVSVTPVCAAGGTASAVTTTFTTTTPTCNPVTGLAVGAITTTSASVSFLPGTGNTSYTVTYTPAGGATTTVTPAPTASPVALSGLTAGTTYTVSVTPVCSGGGTATATTTTFTTTTPTCNPVTALTATASSATAASVSFTPGTGNTGYTVTYTPAGGTTTTVTPNPTASPVSLTGLTANTLYTVSVTPICAGGGTATAVTTTVRTPLAARTALAGGYLSVYPNPAHQSFTLAIPAVSGVAQAQLSILNALGQVVRNQTVALSAGGTNMLVETRNLATGIYTVRVKAGNETAATRLTIE